MKSHATFLLIATLFVALAAAQQTAQTGAGVVPQLIRYSGIAEDVSGKPLSGVVGITFLLYQQEQGGAPLWLETQNVQADSRGHYSVQLGATLPNGVPNDLFVSGEARWLGIQIAGQTETARVMLLSVPYALKAGDAQTLGGLPASAFLMATASGTTDVNAAASTPASAPVSAGNIAPSSSTVTTTGGTVNAIPLFTTATNIQNSTLTQTGTGAAAKIGIGTATPATTLDVKGAATVRGAFTLPAAGVATKTTGSNSQPLSSVASSFSSSTNTAVNQTFQWQAESAGNDTANPSGTLNLLYGLGTAKPSETGLHVASNGQITFASGQTFPGTGTVSSVGSGAGLTGGPITGSGSLSIATGGVSNAMLANSSVTINPGTDLLGGGPVSLGGSTTLNLDTTKVPLLTASNTFTGNQTVNGNLSATGIVTGSAFNIGSSLFAFGSLASYNAFLGFSGNSTMSGNGNTAAGAAALLANTSGVNNTASGAVALDFNTTGSDNTANGTQGLFSNTSGNYNTASGAGVLFYNSTGSSNTAVGLSSLFENTTGNSNTAIGYESGITLDTSYMTASDNTFVGANAVATTGTISNATAIGANAEVAQSNALVLGSISGINGATADTAVGIGTTTPFTAPLSGNPPTKLNIVGNNTYVPLVVQSPNTFGTWMLLNNTSSGGKPWAVLSAASGNAEGAGNLAITDFGVGGTIFLEGNVQVSGNLSKGGGSFKIDHPLDPANKYLSHSFVESPDMMNVYNGNVRTDRRGLAVVTLPGYFEALNRDFRYQLTVIGQFAQAIVAGEISHNRFTIRTNRPGVKVSWQVTGIRHDAFADAHRIPNEEEKPRQERGHYLHPELFGASPEQAIGIRSLPVSREDEIGTAQTSRRPR